MPTQQQTQAQQQTQQQQDELFSSSSQLPATQGNFRYGGQNPVGRSSQAQEATPDEFPPLNRNVNGEIGQDRNLGLLHGSGFGAPPSSSPGVTGMLGSSQAPVNNGLLSALSSGNRAPSNPPPGSPAASLGGITENPVFVA